MKKFIFIFFLLPFIGFSQSYSNPYTPPIRVDLTVKKAPADFSTSFNEGLRAGAAVRQAAAANRAAEAQQELVEIERERLKQDILDKKRIEELERRRFEEEKRIKEENNPNSILNKFKNSKLKQENEDLKNKLLQMELLLAEKLEKDKLEKNQIDKKKILKKNK
jgi:hypothetical protein